MRSLTLLAGCSLTALLLACSGDATAPVRPDAPVRSSSASTLSVTIQGPRAVYPWQSCTWGAWVTGGTPPYSYQWSPDGMIETDSYDNYWKGYVPSHSTGAVGLSVYVTDATGQSRWATRVIQYSDTAPECPEVE